MRSQQSENDGAHALAIDEDQIVAAPRLQRQRLVSSWAIAAFGIEQAMGPKQRAVRLLEEALEAYQAAGADKAMAHQLIDFIFERPVGAIAQELGGIGVTLLALAASVGLNADAEEAREVARVLAKPIDEFSARNAAKNAAGFDTTNS